MYIQKHGKTALFKAFFILVVLAVLASTATGCGKRVSKAESSEALSSLGSGGVSSSALSEASSSAASSSSSSSKAVSSSSSSGTSPSSATSSQSATAVSGGIGYSIDNVKSLTNFTYTTEVFKNGATTTPFQVFRIPTRTKVVWLFTNENEIIGTVEYSDINDKQVDGKYYKQLRFHGPTRRGADTGYKGKNLVSAFHLWEKHDLTSLLNGSGVNKAGTGTVEGLPVTIYTVASGGKTHKVYYNEQYKVWLEYKILNGNTVEERYTAKGFKVGSVNADDAAWTTKLTGNPDAPGYALIDMTSGGMVTEATVSNELKALAY